ncbi:HAD family hydrolase [Paraflavitalea pollutisoli]|uniref:HAD family hydrolase n=1 Tax=Paraflavitalea pollutisoli TaxID=3034143 RepID=UPI0023EB32BA|nr:HAD hydrolase-like protein [Paraflavitalea sp. H1-2-19X]
MPITKVIFDLDLTLIDSKIAEPFRPRNWPKVYELIPSFQEYNGIREVLTFLKQSSIDYCIVTSSPEPYCIKVCHQWQFCSTYTVCYHDVGKAQIKPHPAPMNLALAKLNASADSILSFGDKDIDIISSNAAGIRSVACLWGAENQKKLLGANPAFVANTPIDIIALLNG